MVVILCGVFIILSQVAATTTTPSLTVVSSASTTTMAVMMAPTSLKLAAGVGQHNVVMMSPLILRYTIRGVVGLANVTQQQPYSQMPSWAYTNFAMGLPQLSLFFRVYPPTNFPILVSVMMSAFYFEVPV